MSVLDVILARRSVRDFQDRPVPQQAVDALVEAIRWAPSAGNLQSRKFYFVLSAEKRRLLARAALGQDFIARAPLAVVGCLDRTIAVRYGDRGVHLYAIQDVAASVMNMMRVAQESGLATCWVGAFRESDVIELLDLPDHLRPVVIAPVGYPGRVLPGAQRRLPPEAVALFLR